MYIQRLKTLVDFLKTIPPNKFDLDSWRYSPCLNLSAAVTDDELEHTCGTTACAIGWACTIPEFKAEGLRYDSENGPFFRPKKILSQDTQNYYSGWEAVCKFFEITPQQAEYLFSTNEYSLNTVSAVIDRLKDFINAHSTT